MEVVSSEVSVRTGGENMPAHLARPASGGPYPALVVVMEAFGLNDHIKTHHQSIRGRRFRRHRARIFIFANPTTSSATTICPALFA